MTRWSRAGVVVAVLAACVTALPTVSAAADTVPDAWTTESGGPGNAAINAGETALTAATTPTVRLRWTRGDAVNSRRAPAIVDGVGYEVVNQTSTTLPSRFQAFSVADGTTLWSLPLPKDAVYRYGVSIIGHVAVTAFDGGTRAGGVTAVGLNTRRVLWSTRQAAGTNPANVTAGSVVADYSRVYLLGGTNTLATFGLADGAPGWKIPAANPVPAGLALGNKIVYTGGSTGVVAYDSTTGAKLWTAPGVGAPVVAGGRVITAAGKQIVAVAASGCGGGAQCTALWNVTLPYPRATGTAIGGVDGATGYLTYTDTVRGNGGLVRFSAVSGKVFWRATIPAGAVTPVRGGATVWTVAADTTLLGFSTTATGTRPLVSITEPANRQQPGQSLAIAGGKVFVRTPSKFLTAYGLPGA